MADKNEMNGSVDGLSMPFSYEAEQAVLGCVLMDPNIFSVVVQNVKADYFYSPQHKELYSVMLSLDGQGAKLDPLVIAEELTAKGVFDIADAKAFLYQLTQTVPSTANIEAYCRIVREKYTLRTLISAARKIIDDASTGDISADAVLNEAEQRIFDVRNFRQSDAPKRLADIIAGDVFVHLNELASAEGDEAKGIPTGFSSLDNILVGFNKSDLVLIGARPGMGKTSLALNMARNIAGSGKTVLFFSLEMSADQLASRVLASEASIASGKLRSGRLNAADWVELTKALSNLSRCELYFDDTANVTAAEMKAKIRRMSKLDCVFIDYLGLMASDEKAENRVQEVTKITRALKLMAKELRIPVIVCAQLSRGPEAKSGGRSSRKPILSDLRDSGSIEQDADIVLLLFREDYYDTDREAGNESAMLTAELNIAKNRHGPTGKIDLNWNSTTTTFTVRDTVYEE